MSNEEELLRIARSLKIGAEGLGRILEIVDIDSSPDNENSRREQASCVLNDGCKISIPLSKLLKSET